MATKKKAAEPESTAVKVKIDGKVYEIDPENLEWGEVEQVEIYFGAAYDDINFTSMRGIMFLAYLARRRTDPSFTLDDMRRLKLSDVQDVDDDPPTSDSEAVVSGSQS